MIPPFWVVGKCQVSSVRCSQGFSSLGWCLSVHGYVVTVHDYALGPIFMQELVVLYVMQCMSVKGFIGEYLRVEANCQRFLLNISYVSNFICSRSCSFSCVQCVDQDQTLVVKVLTSLPNTVEEIPIKTCEVLSPNPSKSTPTHTNHFSLQLLNCSRQVTFVPKITHIHSSRDG